LADAINSATYVQADASFVGKDHPDFLASVDSRPD
jgi:hypothetical protein